MGPAGPAEVPGAGSVSMGRTQLDRLLRVIPKPVSVSMNQLRLAANIAGQDQVGITGGGASGLCGWVVPPVGVVRAYKPAVQQMQARSPQKLCCRIACSSKQWPPGVLVAHYVSRVACTGGNRQVDKKHVVYNTVRTACLLFVVQPA